MMSERKGKMKKARILAVLMATLFSTSLYADEVTLKNGDRLSGTIVKSDAKVLVIKSDFAGEVSLQWDAITSIQSTQPIYIGLKDGQTIAGTVTTTDGKLVVDTKDAGTITAPKDGVVTVRNQAEETAYDNQIERLRNPHLTDFWSGFFDTGLSLTRGNSDTLNFALSANAVRKTSKDTITAYANSIFSNNGTGGPTQTTANAIGGGLRVDVNVSDRLYVFGLADFYHNQFQQLDLRNVLGGGLGYHVVNTKPTTFDVYGGADFNQSYYSTPLTQKTGEIMIGEYLSHTVSNRTTFTERFEFFPNVSDTGQYRYTFDAHAVTKLKNWLGWQVSFGDIYVSNPPPGVKGNDLTLSTGLRLTFGGTH
jgi:putative salt-induced outer membrane protein YdiY/small nuclear ribonucleoprotein (snRNP)-like protein